MLLQRNKKTNNLVELLIIPTTS